MSDETKTGGGVDAQRHPCWNRVSFLSEACWRFRDNEGVYKRLVELMMMFARGEITKTDLRVQVAALLEGHQDLLERFDRLSLDTLPTNYGVAAAAAAAAAAATEGERGNVSKPRPKKKIK